MSERARAVVLLSGGLDSATTLAEAQAAGFSTYALTVNYGQRHSVERDAARRVAECLGAERHVELAVDLRAFGGRALTGDIDVPKDRPADEISTGIPVTYVPARNTVMLSLALAWAESLGAYDIFTGVNCVDYSGYPDCRPEFLEAFETLANLATRDGVEGRGRFRIHCAAREDDEGADHRARRRPGSRLFPDALLLRPGRGRSFLRPMRLVRNSFVGVRASWDDRPDPLRPPIGVSLQIQEIP